MTKLFERTLEGFENSGFTTVEAARLTTGVVESMSSFTADDPIIVQGVGSLLNWAFPLVLQMATLGKKVANGELTEKQVKPLMDSAQAELERMTEQANRKPLTGPSLAAFPPHPQFQQPMPVDTGRLPSPISSIMTRPGGLTDIDIEVIDDLLRDYKKIQAIKLFREATRWGLKESKEWVEDRMKLLGVPDVRQPTPLSELAVFAKAPDNPTLTATPFSGTCSSCDIRRHFSTEGWHKCETTDCNGSIYASRTITSEPIAPTSKGG